MPTLLAKVLGLFTINYKSNNKTIKQSFIVTENLFYNRKVGRVSLLIPLSRPFPLSLGLR